MRFAWGHLRRQPVRTLLTAGAVAVATLGLNRPGFPGGPEIWKDGVHGNQGIKDAVPGRATRAGGADGARARGLPRVAVRGGAAEVAAKVGCHRETLRLWLRQAGRDDGVRAGPTSEEKARISALERENRELRQANEILRKASAYFAQAELDRPLKR